MKYNHAKIEPVFEYYLTFGFDRSMQEIAKAVHTTKKTLFNRYLSKENLELYLLDYWQIKSAKRMEQRMEFANNAVEKLLMFLFELQYCRNHETYFFQKAKELFLRKFYKQNSLFIKQLEDILNMGIREELFQYDCEPKLFAYFLQFNVLFLLLKDAIINTDYLPFLLAPILSTTGKNVFKDIDIEQIFK